MPSSSFTINGSAHPPAVTVTAGSTVTLALTSTTGVSTIAWSIVGGSDSTQAIPTITPAGSPNGATATFVMNATVGDVGLSWVVKCVVNDGRDEEHQVVSSYTSNGLVGVISANGLLPFAMGETTERNATHGIADDLNTAFTGMSAHLARLSESASEAANGAILTAAIARVNAIGGGIIDLPAGTFPIAGPIRPPSVPCVIRGAGIGVTVLDWDNVDHLIAKPNVDPDTLVFDGSVYDHLTLEDFTIRGKWDEIEDYNPQVSPIWLWRIDDLTIQRVEIRNCTFMGMRVSACHRVKISECKIYESGRDGIGAWYCHFIQILNNQIDHCSDDAISVHTASADPNSHRQGVVISGNRISDSHGISAMGLRRATISGNQLERVHVHGIRIGPDTTYSEYLTTHSVVIADNTITDVFDPSTITGGFSSGCAYIEVVSLPNAGTGVAIPGWPDGSGTFEPLYASLDNRASGDPRAPGHWLLVTGNTLCRTIPSGGLYSDLGFGEMFFNGGYVDFTITETNLGSTTSYGISLVGATQDCTFSNNIINGMRVAFGIGSTTASATRFENISITGNQFVRALGGIQVSANVTGGKNIDVFGNTFDGDPEQEHSNRGANGTWATQSAPYAIFVGTGSGFLVRNNVFRNWCQVSDALGFGGSDKAMFRDNVWDCDPTATAFSTSNKGIGTFIPGSEQGILRVVDSDPTSANYGSTLNVCHPERNSIPTTGKYMTGHMVRCNSPNVTAILGWLRITNGSNHVLGTDWIIVPTFPINPSTLTIATGAVTVSSSSPIVPQAIDTEAAAASDDLDTISGTIAGQVLILSAANTARTVVLKDGTGNLKLVGDFALDDNEKRLTVVSDGSNLTEIARTSSADIQTFTGNGTWTKPAGASRVFVQLVGSGGGGGGGARVASGTACSGGAAGGAGAYVEQWFSAADLGSSVTVAIATGGTGGNGATGDGNAGSNGAAGSGGTSFGAGQNYELRAGEGGGGAGGQIAGNSGGGGGGGVGRTVAAGSSTNATAGTAGSIGGATGGSGGGGGSGVYAGGAGGGGGTSAAAGSNGGSSPRGSGAGGSGGGLATTPAVLSGGLGGSSICSSFTTGGSTAGQAGSTPSVSPRPHLTNSGGGGGASNNAGVGGAGGNGGLYGGGGGGAGSGCTGNGGLGGNGANGVVIVTTFF